MRMKIHVFAEPPFFSTLGSLFFSGWIALGLSCVSAEANQTQPKPNVIFIVADDMGYSDCGVQGCKDVATPHLNALANGGVRFSDGYVTGAVCSPSRAALMTGRYHHRDGVHDWIPPGKPGLNSEVPTVAHYLRKQGYRTGLVGKWHLGEQEASNPLNRGFDEFFGFLGGGRSYFPDKAAGPDAKANHYTQLVRGREPVAAQEYITTAFAREAADFVTRHKAETFFLYLAFNAVHTPMQAPESLVEKFASITDPKRRTYAAMLTSMDEGIGRVLAAVRDAGLDEKTLICFISDNGGPITRNAPNASQNTPLRGGKGETWEGGIRVPFFVKWKGRFEAGRVIRQPVIQMDVTATVLELAGVQTEGRWALDGRSLLPLLRGDSQSVHDALCWSYEKQWAIRQGKWKLTHAFPAKGVKAPVLGLFDLEKDVAEEKDLSQEEPKRVEEMKRVWEQWQKDVMGGVPVQEASVGSGSGGRSKTENL
jgi:arylsulfatase A-like enzyme